MATLKLLDKKVLEQLFDRGGYVLDFSDRTFSDFFNDHSINIDNRKYLTYGTSKMKRLRAFWDQEPDIVVGKIILALLDYGRAVNELQEDNTYLRKL